jgi:hypothetical protein
MNTEPDNICADYYGKNACVADAGAVPRDDVRAVHLRIPQRVNRFSFKVTHLCAACRKHMRGQFKYAK